MAAIDELSPYRDPRKALRIPVGRAAELGVVEPVQRVPVGDVREIERAVPQQLGAAGPQTTRASVAAAPAAGAIQPIEAGGAISRAQRFAGGARSIAAGAVPAIAAGAAFGYAGRALADNTVGPGTPVAQDGTQIPTRGPGGEVPQAPAAVPGNYFRDTEAGRNIGNIANAVGAGRVAATAARGAGILATRNPQLASPVARAADAAVQGVAASNTLPGVPDIGALAQTQPQAGVLPPTGMGAGRGNTNPPLVNPSLPTLPARSPIDDLSAVEPGKVFKEGSSYAGRDIAGNIQTIQDGGAARPARGGFVSNTLQPGERAPIDIERAALAIERQNSVLRQQAGGPGVSGGGIAELSGGYGARIQRQNDETDVAGRRFDARLAAAGGGRRDAARSADITASANALERLQVGEREGVRREGADATRGALVAETTRRGQDIGALSAGQREAGDLAVERERGASGRDIARIGARPQPQPKFQAINLPDTLTPDGLQVMRGGQVLIGPNGEEFRPGGQAAGAQKPTPRAEYDKMPKGARYIGPDGKPYIKG